MDIELRSINLSFKEQELFSDFSLKIISGEKVWLQAPSGSGKSTLLKLMFGFLVPDKGEIYVGEKQLKSDNISAIRSKMGYVAQNIPLPKLKVAQFIGELMQFEANRNLEISKDIVLKEMKKYGLSNEIYTKSTEELSGGERQRFAFALLTLLNREIWLLDEVTSGLDEKNAERILEVVEKTSATVVVISHEEIWNKLNLKKIQINE